MLFKLNHISQLIFSNNKKHASAATLGLNIHRSLYIKTRFINHQTDKILENILPFVRILHRHRGVVCSS
jgi:hypothetical protein